MSIRILMTLRLMCLLGGIFGAQAISGAPRLTGGFLNAAETPYPSYAGDRYVSYNALVPSRGAVYDRLGQFVNYGIYGLRWNEVRDRYTGEKTAAGVGVADLRGSSSVLQQSTFFNFLAVVRQNYQGQFMSMTLGRNLSSAFSPLVLSHMMYGGLRVDYGSPRQDMTFLLSRGGTLEASLLFSRMRGDERGFEELSPVIISGANWRGHFGALDLGCNFLRQIQSNVKSSPRSLLRGDVPYPEMRSPRVLMVRVTDDSPRDLGGVAVYGADVHLRGLVGTTEVRFTSAAEAVAPSGYAHRRGLEADFVRGRPVGDHFEADGDEEEIVLRFDLDELYAQEPELVLVEAQVDLLVEGDYRIGIRQLYDFARPDGTLDRERTWPFTATGQYSMDQFRDYRGAQEMYFTVRRSRGSGRAGSGPHVVRFKHAIPTAQSFYGVNAHLLTQQLTFSGEFVLNPQDFKFPTEPGKRVGEVAKSGYVTLMGSLGALGKVGAEVFRIEPTYGGWYDSRRGGLVLHTDVREQQGGLENAVGAMTQEFRLYDDNDDHDNWPDDAPGSADLLYMARGAFERPTFPSSRPEGGVYPGLDLDGDFILDHDRNRNAVEDYLEPFFGYDSDPPEFVCGQDLNNNLVPDFRENDDEPDYPYRRDHQGFHLFYDLGRRPWWLERLRLGWYRAEEMVGGHEMRVAYARLGVRSELPQFWIGCTDELKRVHDDIPDDVYRVVPLFDPGGAATRDAVALNQRYNQPSQPPPADFLPMRNSLVNTLHVETGWMPSAGVQIVNSVKYMQNRIRDQQDASGKLLQTARTLHNLSLVNKASVSGELASRLTLTLRVKHLLAHWDEGSYVPVDTLKTYVYAREVDSGDGTVRRDTVAVRQGKASWSLITPELLVTYALTPRTRIEVGQHGLFLPFLRGRFVDRELSANSFTQSVSLLQLTMEGAYGGYRMLSSVGIRHREMDRNAQALSADVDLTAFYVDVVFSPE